jgi:hypothetical protein
VKVAALLHFASPILRDYDLKPLLAWVLASVAKIVRRVTIFNTSQVEKVSRAQQDQLKVARDVRDWPLIKPIGFCCGS